MHHESTPLLAFPEEIVEFLPVQQVVCVGAKLNGSQEGSIGGSQMRQLSMTAAEPFRVAVLQRFLHELFILQGEIMPEEMCSVDGVIVEPRLRIVEVDDMFSQLMEDEVDVLEVQLGFDALLRLDAYPTQRLQHLPHLLLRLRHHRLYFMIGRNPSPFFANQRKNAKHPAKNGIKTNTVVLKVPKKSAMTGPLASLKKFCESLPCSQTKPSGLNLIVWRPRNYQPNEKERRLKVENDVVKQQINQEDSKIRKKHIRTQSLTEPTATQSSYKEDFAKIARKQLSTSLLSREEEEVFGNMRGEGSVREEFKRNHKQVWSFIVRKKKSVEVQESTPVRPPRQDKTIQEKRQQKQRFNQRLHDHLRKWKPSQRQALSGSKADLRSTNRNNSTECSKFTTIAIKSAVMRSQEEEAETNNQKSTSFGSCF